MIRAFCFLSLMFLTGCGGASREELQAFWEKLHKTHAQMQTSVEKIKDEKTLEAELKNLKSLTKELKKNRAEGMQIQARVSVVRSVGPEYEKKITEARKQMDEKIKKLEAAKVKGVEELRTWFTSLPKIESGGKKK